MSVRRLGSPDCLPRQMREDSGDGRVWIRLDAPSSKHRVGGFALEIGGYPRFFKASSTPSISRSWILRLSSKATCRNDS